MRLVIAFIAGGLFGAGLLISGMTNTNRVQGWLDIFGAWDPTLVFVMGGAVGVSLAAFRWVLKQPGPVLASTFHTPVSRSIDRKLILGAGLFGVGWGLGGVCPGPAIASVAGGAPGILVFLVAMFAGFLAVPAPRTQGRAAPRTEVSLEVPSAAEQRAT